MKVQAPVIKIEATITVTPDGKTTIQLPPNIAPGEHKLVLVIDEQLSEEQPVENRDTSWDKLDQLIDQCTVETGIEDLAHQHDHYIHGVPKREAYP